MKCTICGKQAPSGARLCTPCRAALRRARKATVSHFQPLHRLTVDMRARRAKRKSAKDQASKADPRTRSKRPSRLGRQEVAVFVALSVVACAMGILAIRLLDDGAGGRSAATTRVPIVAPQPATTAPAAENAATTPAPVTAPDRVQETAPPAAARPAKPPVPKLVPGIWPMEDAANRHDAARVASVSLDALGDLPERTAPLPEPVAAPASPPPAQTDRWETMDNAIAGCSRQGGFAGALCELRVRTHSCDGYWGRVPQCPAGVDGDRH